jgi:hypothetical protein
VNGRKENMFGIEKTPISPVAASNDPDTKGEVIDVVSKANLDGINDDLGRGLFEQSLQYDTVQLSVSNE